MKLLTKKLVAVMFTSTAMFGVIGAATAEKVSQSRDATGFSKIDISGHMDIKVEVGGEFSVSVEGDDEVLDYLITEVDRSTLWIEFERGYRRHSRRSRHTTVTVTLPNLEGFSTNGSGDAWVSGINSDDFEFEQNGSGEAFLSGTCGDGEFDMNGSGDVEAKDLSCTNAEIDTNGSGEIEMTVTGEVRVSTHGSGEITLFGSPKLKKYSGGGSGGIDIRE